MRRNPYQVRLNKADLTAPFQYQGFTFNGIADVWNAFHAQYADVFPSSSTVVFRSQDLLFRWPVGQRHAGRQGRR